mgnify:CR=1 FL=1
MSEFVHLHNHTDYSLLDAAQSIDMMCDRLGDINMDSIAVTEHGNLFSLIPFYKHAKKNHIKPIMGCEVYVAINSRHVKDASEKSPYHLTVICKNNFGYKNLLQLITKANIEGFYYKPRIDKELLEAHKEGIIAFSGCLASEIPQAIIRDDPVKARDALDWFKQLFGKEHFFLELQNHGINEQAKVNEQLITWAKEYDLNLIATNDVHYLERTHSHAHDALICIGTQTHLYAVALPAKSASK